MASHKFLIVMVLLLFIPFQGIAQPSTNHISIGSDYYSFSGQETGGFPVNESMVSFSIDGQVSNVSLIRGEYGTGIGIVTDEYSVSSFLDMKFNASGCTNIQLGFTWNSSLGLGDTDIEFPIYYGATEISEISISSGKNSTVISELGNSYHLSAEPAMDKYYDLKLFFSPDYGRAFYMELLQNNTSEETLPVGIDAPLQFTGNLSVMAGGTISEICLYNITDSPGGNGLFPAISLDKNWGNLSSCIPRNFRPSFNQAVAQTNINSMYYMGQNYDLISFNYENHTFLDSATLHLNGSMNITGIYSAGESVIILATSLSGSEIFDYNTTSCLMRTYNLTGIAEAAGVFIVDNSSALVFNSNGNLEWQVLQNNSEASGCFSLWNPVNSYRMIDAEVHGIHVNITDLCPANESLITISLTSGSTAVQVVHHSSFSDYDGIINVTGSTSSSHGLFSILESGIGKNRTSFIMNGNTPEEVGQSSAHPIYQGDFQVIDYDGECLFLENSSFIDMKIPGYQLSSLWFNSNQTVGTEINATEIALLYLNRTDAFSGKNITMSLPSKFFIRGKSTLDFNVLSALSYGIYMTIENLTFFTSGESVAINSSYLASGVFTMQVRAVNRAGYTFSGNINCTVDNDNPVIDSQPANNSAIYYGEGIWINVTGIMGNIGENISSETFMLSSQQPDNRIYVPQSMKAGPVQFEINVTDEYGMVFHHYLSFDLMNTSGRNFSANIYNGEYFMTPYIAMRWSGIENVSRYTISVLSDKADTNYCTSKAGINLSLWNGSFAILIVPVLPDGQILPAHEYNITVMEYGPGLIVNTSDMGQYSFFGNSANDTFTAEISSNVTAHIDAEFYSPSGAQVESIWGNDSLNVSVSAQSAGFNENGIYTLKYSAISLSGSSTSGEIHIMVNNTIPVIQGKRGYIYYTNSTLINTGIEPSSGERSYYSLTRDNFDTGYLDLINETMNLPYGQGLYNVSLKEISSSGNTAYCNFTVMYSRSNPEIDISASGYQLRYSNYTVIHYVLHDSVPITVMTLGAGNRTFSVKDPEETGNIIVVFPSNGKFNITVSAVDECMNSNNSKIIVCNVTYYVNLTTASMDTSILGQHGAFSLSMRGSEIQNINESWYINGVLIGTGSHSSANLPLGYSNVTCTLEYDGHVIILTRHVFVVGFYPEFAAMAALFSAIVFIYVRSLTKRNEARDCILKNSGKEISDVTRIGRKAGIPKASTMRQIRNLSRQRDIRKERDLSGNVYIFVNEREKP
ncbi:MAG: hypothetical protein QW597_02380 [Thermoplasmataceae archaeon]